MHICICSLQEIEPPLGKSQQEADSAPKHFACPTCSKAFSRKVHMKTHQQKVHEELEPPLGKPQQEADSVPKHFACPTCSKAFTRKDHVKTHQQKVHEEEVEKREGKLACPVVTCNVCNIPHQTL